MTVRRGDNCVNQKNCRQKKSWDGARIRKCALNTVTDCDTIQIKRTTEIERIAVDKKE
jgi:hypothetical protein